jgi:hypothetical protein
MQGEKLKNLIIRDDDLSYWTKPQDIEKVYKPLFDKKIKISFATIPFAVNMFNAGNFNTFYQDENSQTDICKNTKIVEYIKEKIDDGLVEVMLHGYNHLYSFEYEGVIKTATKENLNKPRQLNKKINFLGEYNYQSYEELNKKTKDGKEYLEDLFKVKITNFVPPSNQIGKAGIKAIVNNNLNLSGLIGEKYNREMSIKGLLTYLDRIKFVLQNKGITYPKIADYGSHKELAGFALTPSTNWDRYYKQLEYSKACNLPFQIATHYWELDGKLQDKFYEFIDKALDDGMKSKFLKEELK